jgi:NADH:ubiquinone oxidoreductase subunit E
VGNSCHNKGAYNVIQSFQQVIEAKALHEKVSVESSFCQKQCNCPGVTVSIDGAFYRVDPAKADGFFNTEVMSRL